MSFLYSGLFILFCVAFQITIWSLIRFIWRRKEARRQHNRYREDEHGEMVVVKPLDPDRHELCTWFWCFSPQSEVPCDLARRVHRPYKKLKGG